MGADPEDSHLSDAVSIKPALLLDRSALGLLFAGSGAYFLWGGWPAIVLLWFAAACVCVMTILLVFAACGDPSLPVAVAELKRRRAETRRRWLDSVEETVRQARAEAAVRRRQMSAVNPEPAPSIIDRLLALKPRLEMQAHRFQTIRTKVAGVSHCNPDGTYRQTLIKRHVKPGCWFQVVHEYGNRYDPNAMAVFVVNRGWFGDSRHQIGYLRSDLAADLMEDMDDGCSLQAALLQVTGGDYGEYLGVNIVIYLT